MTSSLEHIDYADHQRIAKRSLWQGFDVQLPAILLVTFVIQLAFSALLYGWPLPANASNSLLVTLSANFFALISYRRVRFFPGTRRLGFIFSSFVLSWLVAFAVMIVARIDYTNVQLLIGFVCALSLSIMANTSKRQPARSPFLVIPSRRVADMLAELPQLPHQICRTPDNIASWTGSTIVVDLHADLSDGWEDALARAALDGVDIFHFKQLAESLTGRVQIDHLSENIFGTLAPDLSYALIKSLAERTIALVVLIVTLPLLLIAGLAIRLDSPGPALFRQTRIGFRGEPFTIYKLRTMSHRTKPATLEDDVTRDADPRITRVGAFLRTTRIDEIPQLINVLRGEMSIIGPRPETKNLSEWYAQTIDFYAYRHIVLPGITGWAQVKQGHVTSTEDVLKKLQYDFFYIKHFSLWLDIVIALKTVKVMLTKLGAR